MHYRECVGHVNLENDASVQDCCFEFIPGNRLCAADKSGRCAQNGLLQGPQAGEPRPRQEVTQRSPGAINQRPFEWMRHHAVTESIHAVLGSRSKSRNAPKSMFSVVALFP